MYIQVMSNPAFAFDFLFWGLVVLALIALVMTPPKWLEDRIDRSAREHQARRARNKLPPA